MVGYASEGDAQPVNGGANKIDSVGIDGPFSPFARLEVSPEQSAQRQLGAALALGRVELESDFAPLPVPAVPPRPRGKALLSLTIAALFVGAIGAGAWVFTRSNSDAALSVASLEQTITEQVAVPLTKQPDVDGAIEPMKPSLAQVEEAPVALPPEVMADAPTELLPLEPEVDLSELREIKSVRFANVLTPVVMPNAPVDEAELIVFLEAPMRVEPLQPSNVRPSVVPLLVSPSVNSDQFDAPVLLASFERSAGFAALAKVAKDETPRVLSDVPVRKVEPVKIVSVEPARQSNEPRITLPAETNDAASTNAMTRIKTPQLVIATRAAPRLSKRPTAAPANRAAIASNQFSRRVVRVRQNPQVVVPEVSQPQIALVSPVQRPKLIEPKRSRIQRILMAWGSQDITTVEQFARENND